MRVEEEGAYEVMGEILRALTLWAIMLIILLGGVIGFAVADVWGALAGVGIGILFVVCVVRLITPFSRSQDTPQVSPTTPTLPPDPVEPPPPPVAPPPTSSQSISLSNDQQKALDYLLRERWEHAALFITGPAGTGKSTLLRELQKRTKGRSAVVAPTGVAAVNVGGQTIHSFFRFPPRLLRYRNAEDITVFRSGSPRRRVMEKLEWLIIDEISMVRADVLDAIDWSLRLNRQRAEPFGGVRIVMFGDPMQLEPVVRGEEEPYIVDIWGGPFFFNARVWCEGSFACFQLTTLHRQSSDWDYARVLIDLRKGQAEAVARLNELAKVGDVPPGNAVVLTPRRATADAVNRQRLEELPGTARSYIGTIKGKFDENALPAEKELQLKVGAQVMMLRNTEDYINGDLGTIVNMATDRVSVKLRNGKVVGVTPAVWENIEYDYDPSTQRIDPKEVGSFRQIPVRLAWALTIHKAQGLTLDTVHVEFEQGMFAHGQAYVAVTRCRNGSGLTFSRPLSEHDLIWQHSVREFMQCIEQQGYWKSGVV